MTSPVTLPAGFFVSVDMAIGTVGCGTADRSIWVDVWISEYDGVAAAVRYVIKAAAELKVAQEMPRGQLDLFDMQEV